MTAPINYPGNSHKQKDEEETEKPPRVERVVTGEVIVRPPSMWRRFAGSFKGDDFHSVREYVVFDVVIPAFKNMVADAGKEALERALFGETRPRPKAQAGSMTPYGSLFKKATERPDLSAKARATHDFNDLVLADRATASDVLDKLGQCILEYEQATVADLYDIVGISKSFQDEKWGWTDIRGASISRVRDGGYLLRLPQTIPLD